MEPRFSLSEALKSGLGWEDICAALKITDDKSKARIRRVVLNAGGRIGATVRADGSGPIRESER